MPKKKKSTRKSSKRKPNSGFMKPMKPTEVLAAIIGSKALPRTQVVKKIWQYIKKHGLQDKTKRIMINADAKLTKLFGGKKKVNMFEMTKWLNKHLRG